MSKLWYQVWYQELMISYSARFQMLTRRPRRRTRSEKMNNPLWHATPGPALWLLCHQAAADSERLSESTDNAPCARRHPRDSAPDRDRDHWHGNITFKGTQAWHEVLSIKTHFNMKFNLSFAVATRRPTFNLWDARMLGRPRPPVLWPVAGGRAGQPGNLEWRTQQSTWHLQFEAYY